jgi:hypothetical protein
MATVYLKYGTWNNTTKVYDYSAEKSFNALEFSDNVMVKRLSGSTLRGTDYAHKLYDKLTYKLIISADELHDATSATWIRTFFKAHAWKISTWATQGTRWTVGTDTTIADVIVNAETIPYEFLEGHKLLPEVTFELIDKYARG